MFAGQQHKIQTVLYAKAENLYLFKRIMKQTRAVLGSGPVSYLDVLGSKSEMCVG